MRRIPAGVMALALLGGLAFGEGKRFHLSFYGGMTRVMAYGSEKDYVSGSNDFPTTPAHTSAFFGAALDYSLTSRLGIELRGEYALAANMTLVDPSDQDTTTIPSAKHMSFSLDVLWALGAGRLDPYLIAGGGIDKMSAVSSSSMTTQGYEATFSPPARTLDFFLNAGAGLRWNMMSSLGLFLEARYRYLFASPNAVQGVAAGGGIRWGF
jgi:hypothetical protein